MTAPKTFSVARDISNPSGALGEHLCKCSIDGVESDAMYLWCKVQPEEGSEDIVIGLHLRTAEVIEVNLDTGSVIGCPDGRAPETSALALDLWRRQRLGGADTPSELGWKTLERLAFTEIELSRPSWALPLFTVKETTR